MVIEKTQASSLTAQTSVRQSPVSWDVWETVAQVESALNRVGTMRARFLQVSSTGMDVSKGTMFLAQPGRIRLEYDQPSQVTIVSNGWYLIYHDAKLEQTSYIRLDSTPAGVMLQTPLHMKGNVTVTETRRVPGAVEASLIWTNDSSTGELTLFFEERPLSLKQWRFRDLQGQIITVSLYAVKTGLFFDPDLFQIHGFATPRTKLARIL